jgi:hypothetical protein
MNFVNSRGTKLIRATNPEEDAKFMTKNWAHRSFTKRPHIPNNVTNSTKKHPAKRTEKVFIPLYIL